jgi:CRISPR-associated endonuclease Cas1
MTASQKLPQFPVSRKPAINRSGVLTLSGFGIRVWIRAGHLQIEDGVGMERRKIRLARVNHGLKRLCCIGSDGFVSLAALRWLADQDVAFTMLERSGKVLFVTGPVRSSDAKLRRAQALAHTSGVALRISGELIRQKLVAQEQVARLKLLDSRTADEIARFKDELPQAESISSIRLIESQAARAYWSAWSTLAINFPNNQVSRLPAHWLSFGMRVSPLTGSPRLGCNPPNGILNFLYALLESEARLAAAALGLDPGLGVLHVDTTARDSLACDIMEPIRAQVDSYVLDLITREYLNRSWFIEERDGNCRLSAEFVSRLAQTAPMLSRAVAPVAEWVAREFWKTIRRPDAPFATRLTKSNKREAKGTALVPAPIRPTRRNNLCPECGKTIRPESTKCAACAVDNATKNMFDAAKIGRQTANGPEARLKRANTQRKNALAQHAWKPSDQPAWLTEEFYSENVQPVLAGMSASAIARRISVSRWYAGRIREGYRPHPRHWRALSKLAGFPIEGTRMPVKRVASQVGFSDSDPPR